MQADLEAEFRLIRMYTSTSLGLVVGITIAFFLLKDTQPEKIGILILFWLVFVTLFFIALIKLYGKYKDIRRGKTQKPWV